MKRRFAALAAALVLTMGSGAQESPAPDAPVRRDPSVVRAARATGPERMEILMGHGISGETAGILKFLNEGFPQAAIARDLPQEPQIKTEVVNAAIQELGFRQAREAVPVLTRILNNEMPPGVLAVLSRDTERMAVDSMDANAALFLRFVRYNALVALGLIGDNAAAGAIRNAIAREAQPSFVVEGAVALGLAGDSAGIGFLAEYLGRENPDLLREAFDSVYYLTGRNYGLTENTSRARQREAVGQFLEWAAANAETFEPSRASILRRREEGPIREELPVSTVRGALRAVRRFGDYDRRWSARQYLAGQGPSIAPELKSAAEDPLEDIDIRLSAMEWYSAADPKEARKSMKRIEREAEDERLRAQAKRLLGEIDKVD